MYYISGSPCPGCKHNETGTSGDMWGCVGFVNVCVWCVWGGGDVVVVLVVCVWGGGGYGCVW